MRRRPDWRNLLAAAALTVIVLGAARANRMRRRYDWLSLLAFIVFTVTACGLVYGIITEL